MWLCNDDVMSCVGPQPPIELLAISSEGMATIVGNNQSLLLESLGDPFAVDNHPSVIYYVDANNLMRVNLNILNSAEVSKCLHTVHVFVLSVISLCTCIAYVVVSKFNGLYRNY